MSLPTTLTTEADRLLVASLLYAEFSQLRAGAMHLFEGLEGLLTGHIAIGSDIDTIQATRNDAAILVGKLTDQIAAIAEERNVARTRLAHSIELKTAELDQFRTRYGEKFADVQNRFAPSATKGSNP